MIRLWEREGGRVPFAMLGKGLACLLHGNKRDMIGLYLEQRCHEKRQEESGEYGIHDKVP